MRRTLFSLLIISSVLGCFARHPAPGEEPSGEPQEASTRIARVVGLP